MAILHFLPLPVDVPQPDGTLKPMTHVDALRHAGPTLMVTVSLATSFSGPLATKGLPSPQPLVGRALIDTGASMTCIDEKAAIAAGFPIVDMLDMMSASHAISRKPAFPLHVSIASTDIEMDIPKAMGAELACQNLLLLIGRDFLANCTLVYNGSSAIITLAR